VQIAALAFMGGNAMAGIEFEASCDLHDAIISGAVQACPMPVLHAC
jgi:hypothetical protein